MRKIDEQEKLILAELTRNPRTSDNKISKATKVPLKTVNRKRKILEKDGVLSYFTNVNNWLGGTEMFTSRKLFLVKFRYGITRQQFMDVMLKHEEVTQINQKHIFSSHLGEQNGHLILMMKIESRLDQDILEIFNAELVPQFTNAFGKDCILDTQVIAITHSLRFFHNYLPTLNMENGVMKKNWPADKIFVV